MKDILAHLATGTPLSVQQARHAFALIMDGAADPAQMAAMLTFMAVRHPTADELVGAVTVMRERMVRVEVPAGKVAVDTCGTGGDHAGTFNVSTAAALVAAAAGRSRGLVVAKHGNRSVTSNSGSSQVLEVLGVNLSANPQVLTHCMNEAGIAFLFAPNHHPALRNAAAVRAALGFRTILNLLGPLCNPAGVTRQVIGVFDRSLMPVMAQTLLRLGTEKAWVVNGEYRAANGGPGFIDEISPVGRTVVRTIDVARGARVHRPQAISSEGLLVSTGQWHHLHADSPQASAQIILAIFKGKHGLQGAPRDAVVLNAAAALTVGGVVRDMGEGLRLANEALDSGAALETLGRLVMASKA